MNTLYWITRLDGINTLLGGSIFLMTATVISAIIMLSWDNYDDDEEEVYFTKIGKTLLKWLIPSLFIVVLSFIFTPTTKEAYIIWGVGGTIDYLKTNKDAKDIPDKTIKALNVFLDKECKTDSIK